MNVDSYLNDYLNDLERAEARFAETFTERRATVGTRDMDDPDGPTLEDLR